MELMLNELSIEGQFYNPSMMLEAIGRISTMRNIARRFGREVYCHRSALGRSAKPGTPLVQMLSREQQSATILWLTRQGPFWEDAPRHDPNEWFECNGDVVTEAGLAEAAYCSTIGMDRRMVSLIPSTWEYSPITVTWWRDGTTSTDIDLGNYWDPPALEADLRQADPPIESWSQLETVSRQRFQQLNFTANSFRYLDGQPFAPGAAARILSRLDVLDRLWAVGLGSSEGQRLYENHFTGDRAWFSDSSDTEKSKFRREFTFPSPNPNESPMFCTWHGKVNTPPYRIHFSWPVPPGGQLHVVYVGWKIALK